MAKEKFTGVKGMNDMLPQEAAMWHFVQNEAVNVLSMYGYQEIRTPILEHTKVFTRGVGEVTDIVEKEMYSFTDSMNGDQLTLRPECTSAVVRAVNEHNLLYGTTQRLWYCGPMFRHERPQRGRYRQFYQLGAEALGMAGPDIDAEMIMMLKRLWTNLGIGPVRLELNTLGAKEERQAHREALIAYFEKHQDVLDDDAKRRLYTNPLRILDTKNPDMQSLVESAPRLLDYLGQDSRAFLSRLETLISSAGVEYNINPRLVRGLDYYNHTVFEWITDKLGAQGTICGGGRYDPLVEMLGGKPAPGVGFAMGLERVIDLLKEVGVTPTEPSAQVYVIHHGDQTQLKAFAVSEALRDLGLSVIVHPGQASIKSQMKKADSSGAEYVIFATEEELSQGVVGVRTLRDHGGQDVEFSQQQLVPVDEVAQRVKTAYAALQAVTHG